LAAGGGIAEKQAIAMIARGHIRNLAASVIYLRVKQKVDGTKGVGNLMPMGGAALVHPNHSSTKKCNYSGDNPNAGGGQFAVAF
jgi:hypothetical protein